MSPARLAGVECKECLVSVILLMLLVVAADLYSGREVSLWIAYVLPVALASRYCSFRIGAMYAVLAGLLICVAARHTGHPFSSNTYFFLAVAWQTLTLLLVGWLVSRLAVAQLALRKASAARR